VKNIVYLNLFGDIDKSRALTFKNFTLQVLEKYSPDEIYYLISSHSDDLNSSIVMANFISSITSYVKVTTHNIEAISSVANVIFASGQERFASPRANFYFKSSFNSPENKSNRNGLSHLISRVKTAILPRAGHIFLEPVLSDFLAKGDSFTSEEALENGLITAIKTPVIEPGAVHLFVS
jgi:hypothetical protein